MGIQMGRKVYLHICTALFALCMAMSAAGITADAAVPQTVRTIVVRADKENITKKTYTLEVGKSKDLKVTTSPKRAARSIRYSSNKPKIVSVSPKGGITAKKKGTVKIKITVTGRDKKKSSTWVRVKAVDPAIQSVSVRFDDRNVTGKACRLEQGSKKRIKVTVSPSKAVESIHYVSGDPRIANVDQKGMVTAKNAGTARVTITVTGKNNKTRSVWVVIKVAERGSESTAEPTPEPTKVPTPEPTPIPTPEPTPGPEEPKKGKVLVAYFSATNTTERLAGFIADGLHADLHEIVPAVPYTSADLDYGDSNSRSSIEMNDPDSRPAITGHVEDMGQYDIIFLGYPIWWGQAPRIIRTFLEGSDFSGKVIIPFCTSGSSGIGSSATNLQGLTAGAQWLPGRRFGGSASRSDMVTWVNSLGLGVTAE